MNRNPDCGLCGLCNNARTVCLWGHGDKKLKLMAIGEAPGEQEDRSGKPFQGRSGAVIRQELAKHGLEDIYITNVVKCRPPNNRKPEPAEVKACSGYLRSEIERINPTHVLLLGASALKAVLRVNKITEMNGQLVTGKDGRTYVPCFHPAALFRDPSKTWHFNSAIKRFADSVNGVSTIIDPEEFDYKIVQKGTLDHFLDEFSRYVKMSFDVETSGLSWWEEDFGILSIAFTFEFADGSTSSWVLPLETAAVLPFRQQRKLLQYLARKAQGRYNLGQNAKFDNLCLMKVFGVRFYLAADSMLKHHLIDENSLHGLKENARLYLGAPDYDLTSKEKRNMRSVPPARLFLYNALDTHYTLGLDAVYNGQLPEESRRLYDRLVMRAARAFEVIENRGFHVNLERFAKASTVLKRRRAKLLRQLQNSVGYEVNWNSPTQVARVLYEDLGMPVMVTTDKGAPSTGEEALVDMEHPIVDLLKKYREIDKLVSTYIDGWSSMMVGSTLYLGFKLAGTVTGRYASRLHQIPRDPMIRSLIDAMDGWTFVAADYSQVELRIVAELAGEPRMLQIYQTGGDIHQMTAQSVLGVENPTKEERKSAKAVNFGFVYGMMATKFRLYAKVQYGIHLTETEAQEYRDGFFDLYGGLLKWHERMRKLVRMDGQVRNRAGRIRHLPMVNSSEREARNEAERQAINTVVQGFGGDLKAMALVELHETLPEDEFLVFGEHHDAILMAVRNDCLDKHLPSIRRIMQHPSLMDEFGINLRVPILVDIEVGPWSLGEKWNGN